MSESMSGNSVLLLFSLMLFGLADGLAQRAAIATVDSASVNSRFRYSVVPSRDTLDTEESNVEGNSPRNAVVTRNERTAADGLTTGSNADSVPSGVSVLPVLIKED